MCKPNPILKNKGAFFKVCYIAVRFSVGGRISYSVLCAFSLQIWFPSFFHSIKFYRKLNAAITRTMSVLYFAFCFYAITTEATDAILSLDYLLVLHPTQFVHWDIGDDIRTININASQTTSRNH